MPTKQKITPFLWFHGDAEEAANFYCSVFKDARIVSLSRYGEGGPAPAGSVMTVSFSIAGQTFVALDGPPMFKFSEAVSFLVDCETQDEIDDLWDKLTPGGEIQQCGWLKDKFGLSWQINTSLLAEMLSDPNREKAGRVMQAMMQMKKIDIAGLKRAQEGR